MYFYVLCKIRRYIYTQLKTNVGGITSVFFRCLYPNSVKYKCQRYKHPVLFRCLFSFTLKYKCRRYDRKKICNLCLAEKLLILKYLNHTTLSNKRNGLLVTCRHKINMCLNILIPLDFYYIIWLLLFKVNIISLYAEYEEIIFKTLRYFPFFLIYIYIHISFILKGKTSQYNI